MASKIFLIEDETSLASVFKIKLEDAGYQVLVFNSGKDALDYLEKSKETPDLIFLDIFMPYMNGFEVLTILRQKLHLEKIPVIVLSNSGREEELETALKLGATDYLIKASMNMEDLIQKTQKYLKASNKKK